MDKAEIVLSSETIETGLRFVKTDCPVAGPDATLGKAFLDALQKDVRGTQLDFRWLDAEEIGHSGTGFLKMIFNGREELCLLERREEAYRQSLHLAAIFLGYRMQ